jgi:hypothetical protein
LSFSSVTPRRDSDHRILAVAQPGVYTTVVDATAN